MDHHEKSRHYDEKIRICSKHGMIVQGVNKGNHYGPVSIGAPNEEVCDECAEYGKMTGELVNRLGALRV